VAIEVYERVNSGNPKTGMGLAILVTSGSYLRGGAVHSGKSRNAELIVLLRKSGKRTDESESNAQQSCGKTGQKFHVSCKSPELKRRGATHNTLGRSDSKSGICYFFCLTQSSNKLCI
jgi:hypothetical protein